MNAHRIGRLSKFLGVLIVFKLIRLCNFINYYLSIACLVFGYCWLIFLLRSLSAIWKLVIFLFFYIIPVTVWVFISVSTPRLSRRLRTFLIVIFLSRLGSIIVIISAVRPPSSSVSSLPISFLFTIVVALRVIVISSSWAYLLLFFLRFRISTPYVNLSIAYLRNLNFCDKTLCNVIPVKSNETETSTCPRIHITHYLDIFNFAILIKMFPQVRLPQCVV